MSENLTTEIVDDTTGKPFAVHLLDVGPREYGDAILCQFGDVSVLIDGAHTGDQTGKEGHKSIPDQIGELLNQTQTPYHVTLIIVSHPHEDHIGCLPHLVQKGLLTADYALVADPLVGWGRTLEDKKDDAPADERVRQVTAALREEIRTEGTDDQTLAEFLSDAAGLEDRYLTMLETLKSNNTTVIRHERDSASKLINYLESKKVKLKVLGPSRDLLAICAERIAAKMSDAIALTSDFLRSDAAQDATSLYRQIVGDPQDAQDANDRPGPAVNLQSLVTSFEYRGKKLLFAGDMQFSKPQVSGVNELMEKLRTKVKEEGPYAFVKLSHHGSDNAFSEEIFEELNEHGETSVFGICAGQKSTAHPHPEILDLLYKYRKDILWARTDHNRQVTFYFDEADPRYELEKGKINDPKPNTTDEPAQLALIVPEPQPIAPRERQETIQQPTVMTAKGADIVEVIAKVPHVSTRVTLTIEVEPRGGGLPPGKREAERPADETMPPLRIAGGRKLPNILFVTSKEALAKNIGQRECEHVLQSLRSQNFLLYDEVPGVLTEATPAANIVREQLRQHPQLQGVVLLGGYDVIPSQRLDCLPPDLRNKVSGNRDADNFIVWSDDIYGDRDGDGLPELPVSRIPDGNKAQLVFAAIQAHGESVGRSSIGIRNVHRPFATQIYKTLLGADQWFVSRPATYDQTPRYTLGADRVYIMLHGDYTDLSRFWGEDTDENREAVNISNLPQQSGAVVFTGCCWGALTVNTPAGRVAEGRVFGQKSPDDSLAMSFLLRGATAYVGCTGSHYSPLDWPYRFFGGPMHEAFWRLYKPGTSAAEALFNAKLQYLKGMPHGQTTPISQAIEYKILRQYTCLGLGW